MLDYCLKRNELTGEANKFSAQVVNSRSYTFDDIAKHLIKHNTGLSSSVIYGLWEGIKDAVAEYIAEGATVHTELFRAHASIKGVFNGMEDSFDSGRHRIRLNMQPGSLLTGIPKKLKVRKVNSTAKSIILSVTDMVSGSVNSSLTPGKNIRIVGKQVKINGTDPSCGLYFVSDKSTTAPVKVDLSEVVVNKPSEIIAVIPKLAKGNWNVRLVTQFTAGMKSLKAPRNLNFEKSLTVA